jgi:hypothetical protein
MREIVALTDRALRQAGVEGVLPTPLEGVAQVVEIGEVVDIAEMPTNLVVKRPSLLKRVLGAILLPERTIFVDGTLSDARLRFTTGHEIGHRLLPWHEAAYFLDDESTLSLDAREQLEAEASAVSAHLIFQGPRRFMEFALGYQVGIKAALLAAAAHRSSAHSAIRYYVENHPDPVAVLVAGRFLDDGGAVPIWGSLESPSFSTKYGSLGKRFPEQRLEVLDGGGRPFGDIMHASLAEIASKPLLIRDLASVPQQFVAEAFFNGFCHFVLVSERQARRLGRRVRLLAEAG